MRTDLAKESKILFRHLNGIAEETVRKDDIEITRIDVLTEQAAQKLDKPVGRYVTIASDQISFMDREERKRLSGALCEELVQMTRNPENVIVIGLGNRYIAADALGTKTAEYIYVTRHIHMHMKDVLPAHTPVVSSFCANVLGVTGIETVEVVSALVSELKPQLVILIDSLAASRTEHLGCVIQCNNSGIAPGAGVGNFRGMLSESTLGVPVIAVGVPLVIDSETILDESGCCKPSSAHPFDLIVTPKDIDAIVKDVSRVLSDAINRMLFGDNYSEIERLLK